MEREAKSDRPQLGLGSGSGSGRFQTLWAVSIRTSLSASSENRGKRPGLGREERRGDERRGEAGDAKNEYPWKAKAAAERARAGRCEFCMFRQWVGMESDVRSRRGCRSNERQGVETRRA